MLYSRFSPAYSLNEIVRRLPCEVYDVPHGDKYTDPPHTQAPPSFSSLGGRGLGQASADVTWWLCHSTTVVCCLFFGIRELL